jgi:hypothetical protein
VLLYCELEAAQQNQGGAGGAEKAREWRRPGEFPDADKFYETLTEETGRVADAT